MPRPRLALLGAVAVLATRPGSALHPHQLELLRRHEQVHAPVVEEAPALDPLRPGRPADVQQVEEKAGGSFGLPPLQPFAPSPRGETGARQPGTWLVLGILAALVIAAITPVLFQKGLAPFAVVVVYLASLSLVQIFFKMALESGYPYPYTITSFHLLVTAAISSCLDPPRKAGEAAAMLPVSLANGLSVALNNMSLVHAGVGFVTMISSCTPATTCALEVGMKRREALSRSIIAVAVVCSGGMACARGERAFSSVALLLSMSAAFFRSLRCVWQHELLRNVEAPISPCRFAAWSSLLFLAILLPVAAHKEGLEPWRRLLDMKLAQAYIAGSTSAAAVLNISQSVALRHLGPLLQQAVGNLVVVVFLASAWLQETVTVLQWGGTFMIVLGVFLVNGATPSRVPPAGKGVEGPALASTPIHSGK